MVSDCDVKSFMKHFQVCRGRQRAESPAMSEVLHEAKVLILEPDYCYAERNDTFMSESMICAHEDHKDGCQGDSGGPLFIETAPNRFQIVGIVSHGTSCANEWSGVYTNVAAPRVISFIQKTIDSTKGSVCSDNLRGHG
jgi:secreted trypsin-like serine protease